MTLLPGDAEAHRPALERGAGRDKLLFLDLACGIAGDMTVAALVDLGVPFAVVREAVDALGLACEIALSRARTGALGASHFSVTPAQEQPERPYREVRALLARAPLTAGTRALAGAIFERLARAEAAVHRTPLEEVTFHEVGSVDSLVDVVGAAACLDFLGAVVVASPVPLGRGSVRTAHGVLPLPAPATLECLTGIPTLASELDFELVTPTGAGIVATAVRRFERWPAIVPERSGWGAGTRAFADRPNALRVVLGAENAPERTSELVVLEANVDDMTGELAGHVIGELLEAGALDAWAVPATMKKGRPGLLLSALARPPLDDALAALMLRETTSLGVRRVAVERTERPRRVVDVETRFGTFPVKVSEGPYGPPQAKPEFDDCARAARAAGV
ncbi:MAG TPA: nickel pincer cofactor biosynthesis protein LarC, partial [Ilumatobacteraceae bacterium]